MERLKMFMSCVVALALFCFFSAPMVQAQVLDGTTHQVKLSGSVAVVDPGFGFIREGGKEIVPVVLRTAGANGVTGGFNYDINLLVDTGGIFCQEIEIGNLVTYIGENEAIGDYRIPDFPVPGQTLSGGFFAQVKTTPNKMGFKSVAGFFATRVTVNLSITGITAMSKKAIVKAQEKTPEKLGLQCTVDPAP